jgi:hypothetical protein
MNTQLEAIMGSGENALKVGSNPCRTANNPNVSDGVSEPRADSAQKAPESETPKMMFTKVIRHWQSEIATCGKRGRHTSDT